MAEISRRARRSGPTASTVARHGRLRKRSPWTAVAKFTAGALAVLLVSGAGIGAWAVADLVNTVKPAVTLAGETPGQAIPDANAIEGGVNVLVMGIDSREGQGDGYGDPKKLTGKLNDVTMLLHISEDHSNAVVVSFPRDMFVPIPECPKEDGSGSYNAMSSQKINTSYTYGGMNCTFLTVKKLTGLDIQFAAEVQFNGVIALSTAIGGVDVCLAAPIKDKKTDLDLPAGMVTLEGKNAIQFLRTRYGVSDGSDIGRISNQQVYLSALMRKMQSTKTLADPVKLFSIAKVAAANMNFSTGLNLNNMVSIAMALKDIPTENIAFVQYPSADGTSNGESGLLPIESAAETLFEAIRADKGLTITGGTGPGEIGAKTKTSAPTVPPTTAPSSTAKPPATTEPNVELPDDVHGQTAADETCADGNG